MAAEKDTKAFPASASTRVPFALALSALAGCADAIGFLEFSQLFMSFMSGNTTRLGAAVSLGDWGNVTRVGSTIALFCFGAFAGTLVAAWAGRWRLSVLLGAQGFSVGELAVQHHARKHGHSKYGIGRMTRGFFDLLTVLLITRYRRRPLHFFGAMGLFSALLGFACLARALLFQLRGLCTQLALI